MSVLSKLPCDLARSMHKQCSMNWCILDVCVARFQFECTKSGGRAAYEELGDEMEHN